jgi:hypothetical protein
MKHLWTTTLSVSLGLGTASFVRAQSLMPMPSSTPVVMEADQPQAPGKGHPADLPGGKEPKTGQAPERPAVPPAADLTAPPTTPDTTADTGALDSGSVATASSLGMQGRADANNRFNLFDNMAALPSNRIWLGYEYQNKFHTGVVAGSDFTLLPNRQVNLYRAGGEIAIGDCFSIAVQDQYIGSAGSPDSWGNPEFMAKYVLINSECTVLSAILGFSPQVSASANELHERTTRFFPGMLFFRSIGDNLFVQGGGQFGIATNDAPQTIDYAVSFGYWLYRDPRLDIAGRRIDHNGQCCECNCERRWIAGLIPQIEILGKNVIGNSRGQGLDVTPGALFGESQNTYDATFGLRTLITTHMSYSLGFSFPITAGTEVRSAEFLSYLNFSF